MPSHYLYRCTECNHTERRYRNSTKCRECGGDIVRLTTESSEMTTLQRRVDAATQATIEARALAWAAARARARGGSGGGGGSVGGEEVSGVEAT